MRWISSLGVSSLLLICIAHTNGPALVAAQPAKGTLWVFTVGVSKYRNTSLSLQYADNDAESLAKAFQTYSTKVFHLVNTKVLVNQQTSRETIVQEIRSFFAQATSEDTAIIALMGHGVLDRGAFYFLPHPADPTNLTTEGLPLTEFEGAVREVGKRVQRLILAIDTCHAGAIEIRTRGIKKAADSQPRSRGVNVVEAITPTKERESYVLSSSKESEESLEDSNYRFPGEKRGHGAFTYALLRGLRGEADRDQDQTVNVLDLFTYASTQVPKITGDRQHPYFRGEGTNFAVAKVPPQAKVEEVKVAAVHIQQGRDSQNKGDLQQAEKAFALAKEINPRDETPQILHEQVIVEKAYREDPQQQRDTITEAQRLLKSAPPPAPIDPWSPRPLVITFLDFQTLGGSSARAGLHAVLGQRVAQALAGTKRVQVVERQLLEKILEELKLSMSDLSDPATRLRVGRILVARLIATGDVSFVNDPQLVFNLRMIDTETTEIKINLSKDGSDPERILMLADEIAVSLLAQLRREYPIRGQIIGFSGDDVVLNLGAKHGVTPDMIMKAVVEEPVKIKGEIVAQRTKVIGELKICGVEEKVSFARAKGPLKEGTKVIEPLPPVSTSSIDCS